MLISEQNRLVVKPEDSSQLLDLLKNNYRQDAAIFCGEPQSLDFGREHNVFFDLSALDKVREHVVSDMVIAVETGIKMGTLSNILAEHNQFFPVDTSAQNLSLIDVIAAGDGGYLEQGFGYLRSQVLGLELAYEGGKCAKMGGRVVKNVTGFDLTKLVVGGRGVFGLPYLAHLRLSATPAERLNFVVASKSAAELLFVAVKLAASGLPLGALELLESASRAEAGDEAYSLVIQALGTKALVADVSAQVAEHLKAQGLTARELSYDGLVSTFPGLVNPAAAGIELSLSRASAAALIDHLAAVGERGQLRYRPAMGRLFLDCPDAASAEKAFAVVSDFLSNTRLKTGGNALAEFDQTIISRSNPPYRFSSHSPRANDAAFGHLVSRLRDTFDPLRCFNPGVTFHDR
ncbi:MAG: FAD-binding oxidoreductase [Cyanobacteria bacterium SZAS LIN-3]|nr:FAD-binding oxidoreductase [Cyanobacteria bacterium SZAS LIN-3]